MRSIGENTLTSGIGAMLLGPLAMLVIGQGPAAAAAVFLAGAMTAGMGWGLRRLETAGDSPPKKFR